MCVCVCVCVCVRACVCVCVGGDGVLYKKPELLEGWGCVQGALQDTE